MTVIGTILAVGSAACFFMSGVAYGEIDAPEGAIEKLAGFGAAALVLALLFV